MIFSDAPRRKEAGAEKKPAFHRKRNACEAQLTMVSIQQLHSADDEVSAVIGLEGRQKRRW